MHALHEIEKLLPALSRAEKAQVLQWVARDLGEAAFPGIESTPGVCGGSLASSARVFRSGSWSRLAASARATPTCCRAIQACAPKILRMLGPMLVRTGKRSSSRS